MTRFWKVGKRKQWSMFQVASISHMAGASKKEPSALTKEVASILRGWEARTQYGSGALAKTVGVSPAQMSKILAGQKQIDIELFEDMCVALGLNWIEILREAETAISEDRKRA